MTAAGLLDRLDRLGVSLDVEGDRLKIRAEKGAVSPDLLAEMKAQKAGILALLNLRAGRDHPQSFGQRQLWFLERLTPGNPMYNNPLALRLDGQLDAAAMARAFDLVQDRHAILRTVFHDVDGTPVQRVLPRRTRALQIADLPKPQGGGAWEDALRDVIAGEARTGFDLTRETGLRGRLLQLGERAHVLLITVHHICADGWSVGILMDELLTAYRAFAAGAAPDLPALPWQYTDFTRHQQARLTPAEIARQTAYWQAELTGAPALLELPTDRPRPAEQAFDGAHLRHRLSAAAARAVDRLCQARGVTAFAVFHAVQAIVMSRLSGQDDICTGTPMAGRDRREVEPMIGHFINTVVIRTRLEDNPPFRDLLARVNDCILRAMDHQDIAFEKVVEAVNPRRAASHAPLFQTMLIFQNMPGGGQAGDDLRITPLDTDSATAKYDITVELFRTGEGFELGFEYNTGLFDRATVARMAGLFDRVLDAAACAPDRPIDDIALCDLSALGARLTAEHAGFAVEGPQTVHGRFDAVVRRQPDAVAVEDGTTRLSFGALAARAGRAAGFLRAHGIGAGDAVALIAEPCADYAALMLGVLKAGAAFLPVDAAAPPQRISGILADAGVTMAFCTGTLTAPLRDCGHDGALHDIAALAGLTDGHTDPMVAADDPGIAALMFTSGSTGRPKGVRVPHIGLVNLAQWSAEAFALPEGAGVLQKSSIGFDASLWEFLWPLLAGHRLVLARGDARRNPALLPQIVRDRDIGAVQFVPATLQVFLDALDGQPCPTLRHVVCGGGILTADLVRAVAQHLPQARLTNVYGVTEASVDSTAHLCRAEDADGAAVPIGRPVANTAILLLDAKGRPVPQGATGEIHIGGPGVGAGYVNRPDLTAAGFVPHPLVAGATLFRTGDLARRTNAGQLEFLGRRDFQLKLNGFRIEPGEVEAALRSCGVDGAVAIGWRDRLVAYVTGADAPETLKPGLKALLPDYMIPDMIIPLAAFPLNASGKIDRAALPAPDTLLTGNAVNQASPRDAVELDLYNIWKDILLHPTIGIRDNFFDIGGSSIAAIKMLHRIKQAFGADIPLRSVISNPTIEDLGGLLRGGAKAQPQEEGRITFRRGAGRANVVCVHPAGGTAFCYLSLAKTLDEAIGVYGLQSPGLNAGEALSPSVEDMAQRYLAQIADIVDRPLVITGLSFGGLVAHEMGRLLAARGKADLSVVLMDTQGTDDDALRRRIDVVDMPEFRDKLVRFNGTYPGIDDAQIERYFNVYNHNRLTVRDYPVPVSGARVAYVQALSDLPRKYLHESRRYWKSRTRAAFSVRLVRGDHWEMLETEELRTVRAVIMAELSAIGGTDPKAAAP